MSAIKTSSKKSVRKLFQPGKYMVKVKKSSAGLGLFAAQDIPKNACIIEYVGKVIKGREEYTSRSKYLFEVHTRMTIDGQARSNTARYINHSCKANAEPETKDRRVFIFAKKFIKSGEEICYDYGKEYWETHIKAHGCKCVGCKK